MEWWLNHVGQMAQSVQDYSLAKTNLKTPERLEEIQNRTPLRGFAKEKDLGMAAAFLCSDAARFISGIDLVVDGGISSSFLL